MEGYEPYYSLESEGYRLAVMTCSRCGAAVILDSWEAALALTEEDMRKRLEEK